MRSLKLFILSLIIPFLHAAGQGQPSPYTARINTIISNMPVNNDSVRNMYMQRMEQLKEPGLTAAVMMLEKGPALKLEYALSAYSAYVTGALQDSARKIVVKAYCKALKQLRNIDAKRFVINQLQLCGNDYAAVAIAPYLVQDKLCEAAARAMVQIGGVVAKPTLVYALSKAKGDGKIELVHALGELRYLSGLDAITELANTKDLRLRRAALMAMASIGNESSEPLLAAAAEKANYVYDSSNATAAYILLAQRLMENWPQEPARQIAAKVLGACKKPEQLHARIAALQIIVTIRYKDANRILGDAAADKDPAFRAAALKLASKNMNAANTSYWIDRTARETGDVKAGIIILLGESKQRSGIRVIEAALADSNQVIKTAGIKAAGLLGNTTLIASLVYTMNEGDSVMISLIKDVLLTMKSKMVASTVSISLNNKPPLAQIALLQILEEKKVIESAGRIKPLLGSENKAVREQAAKTLASFERS